jgi:hypothetical protein
MTETLTESFCERCGTRYTFESARPRVRLKGMKVFSRGLKNFVLSDDTSLDEAMAAARSETDRESTAHQLDAFHKTFNFCMTCRQYTCPNCWNEEEARCLTCAPLALSETAPAFGDLAAFRDAVLLGAPANGTSDSGYAEAAWASAVDAEPAIAAPEPATSDVEIDTVAADALPTDVDPVVKAAAQTAGLLRRFRPGQSLDAELDAFERERDQTVGEAEPVGLEAVSAQADGVGQPEPAGDAAGASEAPEAAEAPVEAEAEPVVAAEAEAIEAEAVEAEAVEAEPEPAVAIEPEPAVAIEPEPAVAIEPEPVAASQPAPEPEPVAASQPAPEPVRKPEPEPLVAAAGADLVEQPTWRITAPDAAAIAPTPAPSDTGIPLQAAGTRAVPVDGEPQWPARPQWPSATPAAGLPFLGRPATPEGGIDALWAASNQELVTAAPAAPGRAASGIQPCISCGLSLSATARFCRRCGTLQGR